MIEHRTFQIAELRVSGKEKPEITGHAAVFNERSVDLGGFVEEIAPGAFAKTIKDADVRALFNHDPNFILGRTKSGTLSLAEDERGLAVRISPPDSLWANDLLESMKRGDIDQMSFGFRTVTDDWRMVDKQVVRALIEVELFDVSPVTFPAYPQTDVQARQARDFYAAKIKNIVPASTSDVLSIRAEHAKLRERMTQKLWL